MSDRKTDLIEQLFNAISNDPTMPAELKIILLRLQLPIHKLSISDPYFFTNDKHPARRTLYIAKRLSNHAKQDPSLIQKIEPVISQLLKSSGSVQNFSAANQRLDQLTEQLTHDAKPSPVIEATSPDLKVLLNSRLKLILQGHQIPNSCQVLVLKLWPVALLQLLKKHGEKSPQWNNSIDMYCNLLKLLQPLQNIDEYRNLKECYMRVSRSNNNILLHYHDDAIVESAIKSLITHFNQTLGNSNYGQAASNINKISIMEKISSLPKNIKPGVWCEIYIDDVTPKRRLRLSVININTGMLVFVNRNGVKKLEKDALDFSTELTRGLSRVYSHDEIFSNSKIDKDDIRKIS